MGGPEYPRLLGTLTNPIREAVRLAGAGVAWEDLRFPLTQTRQGALAKPDFDTTNVGFLFPQNDPTEILSFIAQVPHAWKVGTNLCAHVHWLQSAATPVTWKLDYKVIPIGGAEPASWTTLSGSAGLITYPGSGSIHQLTDLGEIDMSGVSGLSAIIRCKLYRDDNTTTGDVLAFEADFHYQLDSFGSDEEGSKS